LNEIEKELTHGLRNGLLAYVDYKPNIIFDLLYLSEKENIGKNEPKLIDLLHISQKSSYSEPYFAFINNDFDEWFLIAINQL